jgi:hypothetical protein
LASEQTGGIICSAALAISSYIVEALLERLKRKSELVSSVKYYA